MRLVLYVVEDKETPQFRYRVENLKEVLEDSENWQIRYVLKSEIKSLKPLSLQSSASYIILLGYDKPY